MSQYTGRSQYSGPSSTSRRQSFDSKEELQAELENLVVTNEKLLKENAVFESYLQRLNPDASLVDEEEEDPSKLRRRKLGGRAQKKQQLTLNSEQKLEISSRELDEARDDMARAKVTSEKLLEQLKAVMEETEMRISEVKKDTFEFKRDIVTGAENPRTGKTMAEKVIRYMDDRMRARDALVAKLQLKNVTLKSQIRKMEMQLSQKEEMGEVLHAIDFHQLEIENKQYLEKIEERNNELLHLKLTTGNTVQVLNALKKKLANLTSEQEWLKKEITQRDQMLAKIADEITTVSVEKDTSEKLNNKLKTRQREYEMPSVLSYVDHKAEEFELRKAIKIYTTKVQIGEMTLKRVQAEKKSLTTQLHRHQIPMDGY